MEVTFYRFAKRVNSTKRPSGGNTLQAVMKDKTDLHNPTIAVKDVPDNFNYFSIGTDYYYVTSRVVMPSNWVEYTGVIDPMATYADAIKATRAFVVRSQSDGIDTLVDSLAPPVCEDESAHYVERIGEFLSADNLASGSYIVRFANLAAPAVMNVLEYLQFYRNMNSKDIYEQLKEYFVDVSSMVLGVRYVPINKGTIAPADSVELYAGFVPTGITVDTSFHKTLTGVKYFDITSLVEAQFASTYITLALYLPFAGIINLSPDEFYEKQIIVQYSIDPFAGNIAYVIRNSFSAIVATASGNCSIDCTFGSSGVNIGVIGQALMGAANGAATGSPLGALVGGVTSLVGSGALTSSSGIGGGTSSLAGVGFPNIELTSISRHIPEPIHNKAVAVGLPTFKTLTLGSLSGFVQCQGASVECEGNAEECGEINGFLNNGAFIE